MKAINPTPNERAKHLHRTSKQGDLRCSYALLVDLFGPPRFGVDRIKIDVEWLVETPAGVASIYNYKNGPTYLGEEGPPVESITDWSIGARSREVAELVERHVAEHLQRA